jgi:hypothetical protein
MEGNTLMDELKQAVMILLRKGNTPLEIQYWIQRIDEELTTTRDYVQAISESHRAP